MASRTQPPPEATEFKSEVDDPLSSTASTGSEEMPGPTSCLTNLPNELLTMIAWDDELSEDDLVAFALTCRSIHVAISNPFYSIIVKRNRVPILHWAVERGYAKITQQVLKAGADPNQYWCSSYPKYILELDTSSLPDKDEYFALTSSQQNDCLMQRCQSLAPKLALGKYTRWFSKVPDDEWIHHRLGLAWALQRAGVQKTKDQWLVNGHLENEGHESRFKWTPLHLAVHHGNLELVNLLLDRGAYPAIGSSGLCTCTDVSVHGGGEEGPVAEMHDWSAMHLVICSAQSSASLAMNVLETLLASVRSEVASLENKVQRQILRSAIEALAIASIFGGEKMFQILLDWTTLVRRSVLDNGADQDKGSEGDETEMHENEENEGESYASVSSELLLHDRVAYCAAMSHNWSIVEHFVQRMGPDHDTRRGLGTVLQKSADSADMEACAWLLSYGVEIPDKGRFLRSICPGAGQAVDDNHLAVIMHTLDHCNSRDINSYGSENRNCALGLLMKWGFSSDSHSEASERVIVAMLERGGDLHAKDQREVSQTQPKPSSLTPLGCALEAVATNVDVCALERLYLFLQHHALSRGASSIPQGEYLHKFFVSFGYDKLGRVPEYTLIRMTRMLLLLGVEPEERDARGETALSSFLAYLEEHMPGWADSRCRPRWKDEITYFLACLQKFGARLDSANKEGCTAEQRLTSLQHPEIYSSSSRSGSSDCALPYTAKRRQAFAEYLKETVNIVRDDVDIPRMKFRKPQMIFTDLHGDNLADMILQDKGLWLS